MKSTPMILAGSTRSHTHTFGLHRTEDGSFYFIQLTSLFRTGTDRKTTKIAYGVRNCMEWAGRRITSGQPHRKEPGHRHLPLLK